MHKHLFAAFAALALVPPLAHSQSAAPDPNLARNLAATCANCHGTQGQARGDSKPLAGVPAAAITAMMGAFKSGAASSTIMGQIAKGYSDAQVALIAGYFAAQQPKP